MGPAREKRLRCWWTTSICSFPYHLWDISNGKSSTKENTVSSFVLHSQNWSCRFSWITMGNDQAKTPIGSVEFLQPWWDLSGLFFHLCRISCSKYFSLLASTMRFGEGMAEGEYFFKKLKKNLESTEQLLWKLLMVPRPRKEFQKMRSGNPQNTKGSIITWCLNKEPHLTTVFFLGFVRNAAMGNPSTKDAVPQLVLQLNSYMIISWRNLVYFKFFS